MSPTDADPGDWVYLDHNATTPCHPAVWEAMGDVQRDAWANPSSVHRPGQRARAHLDQARAAVAALLAMDARDVTLTSGGTEANNLALHHPWSGELQPPEGALVLCRLEHPSVTGPAAALAARGVEVRWVDPQADGRASVDGFVRALARGSARLVCMQAVNHETGVLQPVAEIASLARAHGALLHVDAVQAVGKLGPEAWSGADFVTVAAHKIRGPQGIGALVTGRGRKLNPMLRGGLQERGGRPGTLGAPLAAGFAVAARLAADTVGAYAALAVRRDAFEHELRTVGQRVGVAVERNGTAERLAHVTNLSFEGCSGAELCAALDLERVAVSAGAACSAGTAEPSAVITAMLGARRARAAVRLSMGLDTGDDAVRRSVAAFERVLVRAR